jgi:uncharacterized protein YcgI (DUF1989 family)
MTLLEESFINYNTGQSFTLYCGQRVVISAHSIVDFVCFNFRNLKERFSQATTKGYNGKVFISSGDRLYSNYHNPLMAIVDDTFDGTHDLQCEMCSTRFYDRHYQLFQARDKAILETFGGWITVRTRADLPDHGCLENMVQALAAFDVAPEDIPSPLDIFQNTKIVGPEGKLVAGSKEAFLRHALTPAQIALRAEVDCLVALSACPNFYAPEAQGTSVALQIYDD